MPWPSTQPRGPLNEPEPGGGTAVQTDGWDLFFSPQRRSSHRGSSQRRSSQHQSSQHGSSHHRSSQRRSSQRRSSQRRSSQCRSSQRWSSQRRTSEQKPNPNPAVACASPLPICEPEAEPEQHLLSEDVTPPEDQRSPSADQGLPQRTSGTFYEPVCANPNLAVACASAPPVCEPEAETEPGGGVRFLTAGLRTRSRTRTRWWRAFSAPPVFEPEADFLGGWRGLPRQRPV
jgi:hypothetical protein